MKLKELESTLQTIAKFKKPDVNLEQYPTSPHIAAHMIYNMDNMFGDVEDKVIVDLGCGCGMLGIASLIMGSKCVIGIDIDSAALSIAKKNCDDMDVTMDLFQCDITQMEVKRHEDGAISLAGLSKYHHSDNDEEEDSEENDVEEKEEKNESDDNEEGEELVNEEKNDTDERESEDDEEQVDYSSTILSEQGLQVDTVIMNPPFGTRNKGIDTLFLKKAIEIANTSVYSLHKSSTREHIAKKCAEWGVELQVVAQLRWDIEQSYKFHKKKSVDIDVDFVRISKLR